MARRKVPTHTLLPLVEYVYRVEYKTLESSSEMKLFNCDGTMLDAQRNVVILVQDALQRNNFLLAQITYRKKEETEAIWRVCRELKVSPVPLG